MAISGLLLAAGESTRMGTLKALLEWEGTTLLQYQMAQLRAARLGEIVVVLGHEAERLEALLQIPPAALLENEVVGEAVCRAGACPPPGEGLTWTELPPRSSGGTRPPPAGAPETNPHPSPLPEGEGVTTSPPLPLSATEKGNRGLGSPPLRVVYNPDYRAGKTSSIRVGVAALSAESTGVLVLGVDQPRPRELLDYLIERHADALLSLPIQAGRRGHPPIFARALFSDLLALSEEREGLREVIRAHVASVNAIPVDSPLVHVNLNRPEDYAAARI